MAWHMAIKNNCYYRPEDAKGPPKGPPKG